MTARAPAAAPALPATPVEEITAVVDSRHWDDVTLRPDDVIVATYGKAGTTWTLQILVQLLRGAPEVARVGHICRWVDAAYGHEDRVKAVAAETERRIMKSHLPATAMRFAPGVKYVYVARDGRDVAWSAHNHLYNSNDAFFADMTRLSEARGVAGLERPPADPKVFFDQWLEGRTGFSDFWHDVRSWWALREHPQVFVMHFQNLKDDLPGMVRRLAEFLEIPLDAELEAKVIEHSSFAHMKKHAQEMFPGMPMKEGGNTFINKGTNGRWRDVLSKQEIAAYEARAERELGADCAHWLKTGQMPGA